MALKDVLRYKKRNNFAPACGRQVCGLEVARAQLADFNGSDHERCWPATGGQVGKIPERRKADLQPARKVRERVRDDKSSESSRRRGRPAVTGGMSKEKVGNLRELYERTGEIVA